MGPSTENRHFVLACLFVATALSLNRVFVPVHVYIRLYFMPFLCISLYVFLPPVRLPASSLKLSIGVDVISFSQKHTPCRKRNNTCAPCVCRRSQRRNLRKSMPKRGKPWRAWTGWCCRGASARGGSRGRSSQPSELTK